MIVSKRAVITAALKIFSKLMRVIDSTTKTLYNALVRYLSQTPKGIHRVFYHLWILSKSYCRIFSKPCQEDFVTFKYL